MTIRIVTDSTADLPSDLAEELNISVVPSNVVIDDVNYRDGVDLTPEEFYQRLTTGPRLPTTSQPSVGAFQAVYQGLLEQGHDIVSLHVSGKLSGTVNSATQAKAALGDPAIEVIDSNLASIALALVVVKAAHAARQSDAYQEVAEQVRRDLGRTGVFFFVDTLEYLQKGGRIGKAQAFVGSLLHVKPILTLQEGEVHPLERQRNRERAIRRIVELAREHGPVERLAVAYSTEPAWAADLSGRLSDLLPAEEIITSRFGPAIGTYVGPGALGLAYTAAG